MSIFRKCHIKLCLIVQVGDPFRLWLHFVQCFWISTEIGFSLFWTLVSSFGEVYDPFCTVFLGASFIYFQKFQNLEPYFQIFRFLTQENRFFGPGTFLALFHVQKIIDLFTILQILYKFALMLHESFSYEPSRQYGTSPFSKTIFKIFDLIVTGVSGKSGIFFDWIAYWIAYWPLLFRCGITAPCYSIGYCAIPPLCHSATEGVVQTMEVTTEVSEDFRRLGLVWFESENKVLFFHKGITGPVLPQGNNRIQ